MRIHDPDQLKALIKGECFGVICGQVPDCPIIFVKKGCGEMKISFWHHAIKEDLTNKDNWNVLAYVLYKDKKNEFDSFLAKEIAKLELEDDANFVPAGDGCRQAKDSDAWKLHMKLELEREEVLMCRLLIRGCI